MSDSYYSNLARELRAIAHNQQCPRDWGESILEAVRVLMALHDNRSDGDNPT